MKTHHMKKAELLETGMRLISEHLLAAAAVYAEMARNPEFQRSIYEAAWGIRQAHDAGCQPLIFGNGGSAGDGQHFESEMVGQFEKDDPPLPALALTSNPLLLTAVANDRPDGFAEIFSHQLKPRARKGDVVVGISTSGNSENVFRGLKVAKDMEYRTIAILGQNGGKVLPFVNLPVLVPSKITAHVQEGTIAVIHAICKVAKLGR